jgi:Tfp pilus assembly protein PilN
MKAVNLLPADYKQVRQASFGSGLSKHPVALGGTAAAVVVAALLGVSYQSASKDATRNQNALDALNARIAAVSQPLNAADQSVRERVQELTTADAARVSWDGFMAKLARVLPEDVWLNTLSIQETAPVTPSTDPAAPAAPAPTTPLPGVAPTGFTVTGFTYSQASVARLMRRLSMLPWLSDISLQNSNVTTVGAHSVYQFTIVGGVNALPAKEAS